MVNDLLSFSVTAAHIIQDSGGFMEALLTQPKKTPPMVRKKRSSTNKTPTSPTEKTSPPGTPLSPLSAPPSVSFFADISFYQTKLIVVSTDVDIRIDDENIPMVISLAKKDERILNQKFFFQYPQLWLRLKKIQFEDALIWF